MAGKNVTQMAFNYQWGNDITFTFLTGLPPYQYAVPSLNDPLTFQPFSLNHEGHALSIISHIQTFANINFTYVHPSDGIGDIALGRGLMSDRGVTGQGVAPGQGGDIFIRHNLPENLFFATLMHEFGHSLGMAHPDGSDLDLREKNLSYTVMYNGSLGDPLIPPPRTFMLYDIALLQNKYGARDFNTGDNVYSYGSVSVRETIWDTGGTDTISAAGASKAALINLNEGTFSSIIDVEGYSIGIPTNNIAIAFDVTIERAIGSSHGDIIIGNHVSNSLNAGAGNDTIFGDEVTARAIISADSTYRGEFIGPDFWFRGQYQSFGTTGPDDHDLLFGEGGDDYIFAGRGNDEVDGGAGNDFLDGGAGQDVALYESIVGTVNITRLPPAATPSSITPNTSPVFQVAFNRSGASETDMLRDFETVRFGDGVDRIVVEGELNIGRRSQLLIDGAASPTGTSDVLDLSSTTGGIFLNKIRGSESGANVFELYTDASFKTGTGVQFKNFEEVKLGDDDDVVLVNLPGLKVTTGDGADKIQLTNGVGITDLSGQDRITIAGQELHGGTRYMWSESPWATSFGGAFKYGINVAGELLIEAIGFGTMYVLNWTGSGGMSAPFEQRPGQISVFEYDFGVFKLMDQNKPSHMTQMGVWDLMGAIVKALFGIKIWKGNDPLTLDLDGDGLELTSQSSVSPFFDMDGDLYAERSGWVSADDGVLVRDLNGNGAIDDVTEMFGGAQSGFDVLATLDGNDDGTIDADDDGLADFNGDGVVDANDTFASLKVWRDLDQDLETDAGELFSLADLGIVSISLDATEQNNVFVNGNQVAKTATFTRADATTGTIADVWFKIDNINTRYDGAPITISAEAAALPEHKGFGTLLSLRQAMSLSPGFVDTVENTLSQMSSLDLDDLRMEALPILIGWAQASPLGDGDNDPNTSAPKLKPHDDIDVLVIDGPLGRNEVIDFAYRTSSTLYDQNNQPYVVENWALASGAAVRDANNNIIEQPTLAQVKASPQPNGTWTTLDGDLIAFAERYIGESLPLDRVQPEGTGALTGFTDLFTSVLNTIDLAVVRIATQGGPLSSFFAGIEYDAEGHHFRAAEGNDRELMPVFEAIFTEAKLANEDAAWIAEWKPILDIVIGDFVRGEAYLLNTYGFLTQNIVAAYEDSELALAFHDVATALGIPGDVLMSGSGTLTGTGQSELFYSTGPSDVLRGGLGPDTYIFGHSIGHDIVEDIEPAGSAQVPDTIRFAHLTPADITTSRNGLDLIITVTATGETITVVGQFIGVSPGLFGGNLNPDNGVGEIVFADGTVWDAAAIAESLRDPQPTSDTITGTAAIDFLDGGAGNDVLSGGDAGDFYYFGIGYGQDAIHDQQTNVLVTGLDTVLFGPGLSFEDLSFSRDGASLDLVISIEGEDDELVVVDQFAAYYTVLGQQWFSRIEVFAFADGDYVTWQDIMESLVAVGKTEGDDTIYGFAYADVLDGGAGNDFLAGGNENDVYIFGTGYGSDVIDEDADNILGGMVDTVRFTDDVLPEDVTFTRDGATDDLLITLASGDVLRVQDQFHAQSTPFGTLWFDRIEYFEFPSTEGLVNAYEVMQIILDEAKTEGDDHIYGYFREDVLDGGAGNDYLAGGGEGDTYLWGAGYGNDVVFDADVGVAEGANVDRVAFLPGLAPEDIDVSRNGDDLIFTIASTGETLTVLDQLDKHPVFPNSFVIEEFRFADDTVWTLADLRPRLLAEAKTPGDDTIVGFYTADRLDGGAGNDLLTGEGGGDTYVFGRGYGHDTVNAYFVYAARDQADAIEFTADVAPEDVQISRNGYDLVLTISGTDDVLTIKDHFAVTFNAWRVEEFRFNDEDETVWTWEDIQNQLLIGTSGNDELIGFTTNDYLDGGLGNDILKGRGGDDTYVFGLGYGHDTIDDDNNSAIGDAPDRLIFGEGLSASDLEFVAVGQDDLVVRVIATDDEVTIKHHFASSFGLSPFQIASFAFANGTSLTAADVAGIIAQNPAGMVTHRGTAGSDVLAGTDVADVLDGRGGDDLMQGGWGSDTYHYGAGSGNDTIGEDGTFADTDVVKLSALNASDVTMKRSGNDLFITINATGEELKVTNHFSSVPSGIEQVQFADNTTWDRTQIQAASWLVGTSGDDTINGTSANETLDGLAGNDLLNGGSGDDTYIYRAGSGNDTIQENGVSNQVDKVNLVNLLPSDVTLRRTGNDLFVTITATGEELKVQDHFLGAAAGIEQLVFGDNTVWDATQIQAAATIVGTSADETIVGTSAADTIDGLGGADILKGAAGSDTYLYRAGSGNDSIEENGLAPDVDKLKLLSLSPSDVSLTRVAADLFITVASSAEVLKVKSQFSGAALGIEQLIFGNGTTWDATQIQSAAVLIGTSGADTLNGANVDETLDGGAGNDTLHGNGGNDTLLGGADADTLNGGDGNDNLQGGSGNDTLNGGEGNDNLQGGSDNDALNGGNGDDTAHGGDGTDVFNGGSGNDILLGGDGNDTFNETTGNDTFTGGLGNDTFRSGIGNDTYIYASGDGNDLIDEDSASVTDVDILTFTDLNPGDITLTRDGSHFRIGVVPTGHEIYVEWQFWSPTENWGLEQFQFQNGTTWNRDQIMQNIWWNGTAGNDTMSGWGSYDQINGGAGNDTINGNAGIDTLLGGDGNDTINGNADADTLFGGVGNDTMTGGTGNDKFVFQTGFGQDTINDLTVGAGSDDVIEFRDGIFADFAAVQAASAQVGADVRITVDASNTILIKNVTLANLHQDDFLLV